MKKIGYIGLLIGFIILINTESQAQYYYTSYGYGHEWHLPKYVHHSIYDNYYGYEIAHVNRYKRHGKRHYNILIHRNGWFVELKLDHHGHIYKTTRHRYYNPLITHHCTNHCGYHKTYFQTYYPKYHNHHHGYSTTVYVNSTKGHHHKHNNYYSNIYIEQPNKKTHYKSNAKQNKTRSSQTRTIRQPQQKTTKHIEHRRSNSGSRMQQANNRQVVRQNTSRGRTREVVAQNNERSSRNR